MKKLYILSFIITCLIGQVKSQTLIINEVSNGILGSGKEYVELLVVGTPTCNAIPTMDLRGYYIDDNNGAHGTGAGMGIDNGCIRFKNNPFWANIPIGTLIVVCNDFDMSPGVLSVLDTVMSDGNCRLVIPVGVGLSPTFFETHTSLPNTSSAFYPTTGFTLAGNWNSVLLANGGDSFHVVNPLGSIVNTVSWGNNTLSTNIYFPSAQSGSVIAMTNAVNNSYTLQANWTNTAVAVGETPGAPNNPANAAWIQSMNNSCMPLTPLAATKMVSNSCLCNGSATIIPTGAIGPYTYTWSPSISSGSVATGLCPGSYSVNVRSSNGCITTTTLSITSLTTAIVANSPTVCAGSTTTLIASGASTYTWSNGSTGSSILITPSVNTSYTVSGTNTSGCINTKTVNVTVNPRPIVTAATTATSICIGGLAILSASGAISYTWYPVGISLSSIPANPIATTVYTVTGVNANGCSNTATISVIVNPCTSINEYEDSQSLSIFPNPAKTEINIITELNYSSLVIVNSLGQFIFQNEKTSILSIESINNGVYFIQLLDKENKVIGTKKFIKE
jgi:hypothetical protein